MVLKEIIDRALAEECSDIHLTVGTNMAVRKFGTLEILSEFTDNVSAVQSRSFGCQDDPGGSEAGGVC